MNFDDLLDMKLKDILENYSVLWNYECAYPYGICPQDLVERMYDEYDVQSYWEAMTTEIIMDNLGIMRKDEQV